MSKNDISTRFLFEEADIRGESVRLRESLAGLLAVHDYSPSVRSLLGEFAAAVVLISNNLKYRGRIILQARSAGALSLVMVECTSEREIRGIARGDICTETESTLDLIPDAQLAITIERDNGQRYQGIVALESDSLATALDNYFFQSEQLHTRFWLTADANQAAGMMLQQLPAQLQQSAEDRENQWENARVLAETITPDELKDLDSAVLLHRLYHEESMRVFEPQAVVFRCSCSRERSRNALSALSADELNEILAEEGVISMDCEMCGAQYRFEKSDLSEVTESRVLH